MNKDNVQRILSTLSAAKAYFNRLIRGLDGVKIKAVYVDDGHGELFAQKGATWIDAPIFILFENSTCLEIEYYFVDELYVQYRTMTEEEIQRYQNATQKDYFNGAVQTAKYVDGQLQIMGKVSVSFSYESIMDVRFQTVTAPYDKWIDGHLIEGVAPTDQTFDQIEIVLSNGNTIFLCPVSAEFDGYVECWSPDAYIEEKIID